MNGDKVWHVCEREGDRDRGLVVTLIHYGGEDTPQIVQSPHGNI